MQSFSGYCRQTLNFFAQMLILVEVIRLEYQVGVICIMIRLVLLSLQFVWSSFNVAGFSSSTLQSYGDPGCVQSVSGNNFAPPMLLFAKTRKLSVERPDPRKYLSLSLTHMKYCSVITYGWIWFSSKPNVWGFTCPSATSLWLRMCLDPSYVAWMHGYSFLIKLTKFW